METLNELFRALIRAAHTYEGALTIVFTFSTLLSASTTQMFRDTERSFRSQKGKPKHPAWNHILRAISTFSGGVAALLVRRVLVELPREVAPGEELVDLVGGIPSFYISTFVGCCAGFFLTTSIPLLKWAVQKWNPEVAQKIPDFGANTAPVELSEAEQLKLESLAERPVLKESLSPAASEDPSTPSPT